MQIQIEVGIGGEGEVAVEVHRVVARAAVDGEAGQGGYECTDIDDVVACSGVEGDGGDASQRHIYWKGCSRAAVQGISAPGDIKVDVGAAFAHGEGFPVTGCIREDDYISGGAEGIIGDRFATHKTAERSQCRSRETVRASRGGGQRPVGRVVFGCLDIGFYRAALQVAREVGERTGGIEGSDPAVGYIPVAAHIFGGAQAVGGKVGMVGIVGIDGEVAARADAGEGETEGGVALQRSHREIVSVCASGDGALEVTDDVAGGAGEGRSVIGIRPQYQRVGTRIDVSERQLQHNSAVAAVHGDVVGEDECAGGFVDRQVGKGFSA